MSTGPHLHFGHRHDQPVGQVIETVGDTGFGNNVIAVQIDRDMAIAMGAVEPTPEEAERIARQRAQHDEQTAMYKARTAEAAALLDALDDPVSRLMLDLHRPVDTSYGRPECRGCDFDGFDGEPPQWPCSTTQAIAKHHDIAMPGRWVL